MLVVSQGYLFWNSRSAVVNLSDGRISGENRCAEQQVVITDESLAREAHYGAVSISLGILRRADAMLLNNTRRNGRLNSSGTVIGLRQRRFVKVPLSSTENQKEV